ncbi:MAG: HNH endonuclease [Actinomycetota bacterium]|jgi:CRISPR-associated endonuclease Csn1|nr:HNH endonuclease [Actinomycetota bacterium]
MQEKAGSKKSSGESRTDGATTWRLGVDVGDRSVGLAAVEYDDDLPVQVLAAVSVIHDGGTGGLNNKTKASRKAVYGVKRRIRRSRERRRRRLAAIDRLLEQAGFVLSSPTGASPLAPWLARRRLIESYVDDDLERAELVGRAISHIARHRGWRNPWISLRALEKLPVPSPGFTESIEALLAGPSPPAVAPRSIGELGALLSEMPGRRVSPSAHDASTQPPLLLQRPRQEDVVAELRRICAVQRLEDALTKDLVQAVFEQVRPSVPVERVGICPLSGEARALRCSLEFEEFRIREKIANLRYADDNGELHPLDSETAERVVSALLAWDEEPPTWADVALDLVGLDSEGQLVAPEDDRISGNAPIDHTSRAVRALLKSKSRTFPGFAVWWHNAGRQKRSDVICALVDATTSSVLEGFDAFPDDELTLLAEHLTVASGRAKYSRLALERLNARMRLDGVAFYEASRREFNLPADWHPPLPSLTEPTGQPTVDANIAAVRKFLASAALRFGPPAQITVEIAREGSKSPAKIQEDERRRRAGRAWNDQVRAELRASGIENPRPADVWKQTSIGLYDARCLYCGSALSWDGTELDHVVPRADGGVNLRANLAAVCVACNRKKGRRPFGRYAKETGVDLREVVARVRALRYEAGGPFSRTQFRAYQTDLCRRLRRVSADDEDARDIQATSYAALAVRERLQHYLDDHGIDEPVRVFSGGITAEARWVAGIRIAELLGRAGLPRGVHRKRIDRRHHALDAAILTTICHGTAMALAARRQERHEREFFLAHSDPGMESWKVAWDKGPGQTASLLRWLDKAHSLANLLGSAAIEDRIAVTRPLRLRPTGPAHAETIVPLKERRLGEDWGPEEILRVCDPAIYRALAAEVSRSGRLLTDLDRCLQLGHGRELTANDHVALFPGKDAMLRVPGGAVEMKVIHHARVYAWHDERGRVRYGLVRVFLADLASCGLLRDGIDVFQVALPDTSMSLRDAHPETNQRVRSGSAAYLGWLVAGDEIELAGPTSLPSTGHVSKFAAMFPERRWVVAGIEQPTVITLRPAYLAGEGLNPEADVPESVRAILGLPRGGKGWRPSVNVLLSAPGTAIIRRTALGRPRWHDGPFPSSWNVRDRVAALLQ